MSQLPIDLAILKLLLKKESYDRYADLIIHQCFEQEVQFLLQAYKKYYKEFNTEQINLNEFASWFFHIIAPDLPESKREIYTQILNRITLCEDLNTEVLIKALQEKQTAFKLSKALETRFNIEELISILSEHEKILQLSLLDDKDLVTADLKLLLAATSREQGLRWRLDCLNQHVGTLQKGTLVLVAAYVDVGKTMFAISESTFMAKQLTEGCVLWLNNEEDNYRVLRKIWKSVLGCDDFTLAANQEKATQEYISRMNGDLNRIKFIDIRNKNLSQITKLIEKYDARLVVIDQVDKIYQTKHKSFSEHDRLKNLYGVIRDLANKYCPIMAISQADVTTTRLDAKSGELSYTLYPHHRQLDGSKVGKPGEADVIIMIGKREGSDTTRGIHISKNKFGSVYKQEVVFKPEIAQYRNP